MVLAIIDGDVLLYQACWGNNSLQEAIEKFEEIFEEVLESAFATDYVMALGGPDNFREDLYLDYKKSSSRQKSKSNKPEWFNDLKSYAANKEGACISDNCEADDLVRIWAMEAKAAAWPFIVVSIDKDLDCIPGKHSRRGFIYDIDEDYADYFYWKQILMGDNVDNIPGIKGCGPVKADKILNGLSPKERRAAVCRAYHEAYGEDGYSYMIANGRLIHIWRHIGDYFKISKDKYNDAIS